MKRSLRRTLVHQQLYSTINTASRVEAMRDTLTIIFKNKYRHTLNKQRLYEQK